MSQLEVDKIIPQSGTTLTIGDSGDTITFGTGTTPQLGGDLDLNSNDITGTGNINITGNATVSGDLTVDTDTLYVDSASNLVGIGTTSPAKQIDISGNNGGGGQTNTLRFTDTDTSSASNQTTGRIEFYTSDSDGAGVGSAITGLSGTTGIGNSELTFEVAGSERMRIDSSGNVGIGTSSPSATLNVNGASQFAGSGAIFPSSGTGIEIVGAPSGSSNYIQAYNRTASTWQNLVINANIVAFGTAGSERMRIDSSGNLLVGKATGSIGTAGTAVFGGGNEGLIESTRDGAKVMTLNRLTSDGDMLVFRQDGSTEGVISVSGITVTYGGFTGSHWSRLSDNSKPTILKGTILESLDEMMDWYQVQFDITDDEGNTITEKQSYALGDGESVGDVITYNYNTGKQDDEGNDIIEQVQATIIQEDDIKHVKSKVSDTVDAKNVYGVFSNWDNDDDTVNDMNVAQTGTFVVRMNSAETVSKGDLIQSNGDGTGKVQADDIIRASTVAKVISTTKVETYDDGSYIVPCTLHC